MSAFDELVEAVARRLAFQHWIGEGVIKQVRKDEDSNQILLDVVPVPEFDHTDDSADFACTMKLVSPAVSNSGVLWVPPAVDDWCVFVAVGGDPGHGGYVIGYANNSGDPIPSDLDLAKAYVRIPDGMDATIQVRSDYTIVATETEVTISTNGKDVIVDAGGGSVDLRGATVKATASGTGEAVLALQADLSALETAYLAHKHTGVQTGGGSSAVSDTPVTPSTGTTVLKGQ